MQSPILDDKLLRPLTPPFPIPHLIAVYEYKFSFDIDPLIPSQLIIHVGSNQLSF